MTTPTETIATTGAPAFGQMLTAWLRHNGWSQQVPHDWAAATGSPGPWNSQLSTACRNQLTPKPGFFIGLANFNAAVAQQQFRNITSQALRQRLRHGLAIAHPDGTPYSAGDFFNVYIGALMPPEWLQMVPPPAPEPEPEPEPATDFTPEQLAKLAAFLKTLA